MCQYMDNNWKYHQVDQSIFSRVGFLIFHDRVCTTIVNAIGPNMAESSVSCKRSYIFASIYPALFGSAFTISTVPFASGSARYSEVLKRIFLAFLSFREGMSLALCDGQS